MLVAPLQRAPRRNAGRHSCRALVELIIADTKNLLAQRDSYNPKQESWIVAAILITLNAALTVGIDFVSFHLYEKQFLKLKRFFLKEALIASPFRNASSEQQI
jgi:hypothetical protein